MSGHFNLQVSTEFRTTLATRPVSFWKQCLFSPVILPPLRKTGMSEQNHWKHNALWVCSLWLVSVQPYTRVDSGKIDDCFPSCCMDFFHLQQKIEVYNNSRFIQSVLARLIFCQFVQIKLELYFPIQRLLWTPQLVTSRQSLFFFNSLVVEFIFKSFK